MSNYTTGQAVMWFGYGQEYILFVEGLFNNVPTLKGGCRLSTFDYSTIHGEKTISEYWDKLRPATQAEILAEAARFGWVDNGNCKYHIEETQYIYLCLSIVGGRKSWGFEFVTEPTLKNLAKYGNECITAHRLITSLNLAK